MIGAIITAGFGAFSAAWRVITHGFDIRTLAPTPAERILYVPAETRSFSATDQRTLYVPQETRSFTI